MTDQDWLTEDLKKTCPMCGAEWSEGFHEKTVLACAWYRYRCGTYIYDNRHRHADKKLTVRHPPTSPAEPVVAREGR